MTIITRITVHPKKEDWFYIYVDRGHGEEFGFTIDSDLLIRYHLQKGMTVDDKMLQTVIAEKEKKRAFQSALSYLSYRMRSEYEIIQYLKRKEFDEESIHSSLKTLKEYHYVDDPQFSKSFVSSKFNAQLKGPIVIAKELKKKGISSSVISSSLSSLSFEEQVNRLVEFIEKKQKKTSKKSLKEVKQKLYQQLYRKGFESIVIEEAFENAKWEYSEESELEALRYHGEKALYKYRQYSGYDKKMRVKRYLIRKGFSFEQIDFFLQNFE